MSKRAAAFASVDIAATGNTLEVTIADDGAGGADPARGYAEPANVA